MENKNEVTPSALATQASVFVSVAQSQTGMSLLELAAMFRIAATVCDEANSMHERAKMTAKISGWTPGK